MWKGVFHQKNYSNWDRQKCFNKRLQNFLVFPSWPKHFFFFFSSPFFYIIIFPEAISDRNFYFSKSIFWYIIYLFKYPFNINTNINKLEDIKIELFLLKKLYTGNVFLQENKKKIKKYIWIAVDFLTTSISKTFRGK